MHFSPVLNAKTDGAANWLQKSDNWELEIQDRPSRSSSNITFHLQLIWLQTLLQSIQDHARHCFQALLTAMGSSCSVWLKYMSRCPFLRHGFYLDLLLCTGFNSEHVDLFLCPMFTQRPQNDQNMEQWNERLSVHEKFHFTLKKRWLLLQPKI